MLMMTPSNVKLQTVVSPGFQMKYFTMEVDEFPRSTGIDFGPNAASGSLKLMGVFAL